MGPSAANGVHRDQRNGHAARRSDNPPQIREVFPMTTNTNEAAEVAHFEKFFALLLANFPRRDAADEARSAVQDCLAKSKNPGQTRCCLLDGAEAYEVETRAKGSTAFLRLDDFVRSGIWQAENLPHNLAQAAARAAPANAA